MPRHLPRHLFVLVLAFFCAALLLMRALAHSPTPAHAARLRLAIATDPIHLDPLHAGDSISGLVLRMIYEGLTRLDDQSQPTPALASSWKISADGREYTFQLRHTRWSNGAPLTAHDFETAWKRMIDPAMAAPNAYLLYPIEGARRIQAGQLAPSELGVVAMGPHCLRVRLEEPIPYFLQLLAFDAFFPVCSSSTRGQASLPSLSCGPFILSSWKPKDALIFEANPRYWDRSRVAIEHIEMQVIADAQTALYLFEQQAIDWIGSPLSPIPPEAVEALSKEGRLQSYPPSSTYWIHCQLSHPVLRDLRARRALSMAIDRAKLAALLGLQHSPATALIPPLLAGYEQLPHANLQFNPQLARQLWEQICPLDQLTGRPTGGQADQPLVYLYNSSGMNNLHAKVAQLLQSQWREHLGVQIELRGIEWALFLERARRGDFDLARFGWPAQFADPTTFLDIFESPQGAYNFSRYCEPRFEALMEKAHHSLPPQRQQLLADAERQLLDDLPVIPLFFGAHTFMKHPKLKGVVVGPLGRIDFKMAYWEMERRSYTERSKHR